MAKEKVEEEKEVKEVKEEKEEKGGKGGKGRKGRKGGKGRRRSIVDRVVEGVTRVVSAVRRRFSSGNVLTEQEQKELAKRRDELQKEEKKLQDDLKAADEERKLSHDKVEKDERRKRVKDRLAQLVKESPRYRFGSKEEQDDVVTRYMLQLKDGDINSLSEFFTLDHITSLLLKNEAKQEEQLSGGGELLIEDDPDGERDEGIDSTPASDGGLPSAVPAPEIGLGSQEN